jgi:hypothetical protein
MTFSSLLSKSESLSLFETSKWLTIIYYNLDPIYWNDKKKEWSKDALSQDKTPLRVVYYLDKNAPAGSSKRLKVCGVMTHSTVDANNEGKDSFQKC